MFKGITRSQLFFLLIVLSFPIAVSAQDTYLDRFNTTSYSNNDGSQNFSSNWIEVNDNNSPSGGTMRILSNQLRFGNLDGDWMYRFVPLSGASSVTLTLDYDASNIGNETLEVYIYNNDTGGWNQIASLSGGSGSISYDLSAAEIASDPAIIFYPSDNNWGGSEEIFIDNVLFTASTVPILEILDVTVDEDAGTADFTVTHTGANAGGAFTVNYTTSDGTAIAGSDYTSTSGTLNFNGTSGDTEQISVSITDDGTFENIESFTVSFTGSSDGSVDITDTATGTIIDDDALIMTDGVTENSCNDVFLDPGGVTDYGNNLDVEYTICPDTPGNYISVDFSTFDVATGDVLYVYDGTSTGGTLLGTYDNTNVPTIIDAGPATGCLTFRFTSNGSSTGTGWEAQVTCYPEGPKIVIDDISFDEDVGNAVFTVTQTRARHGFNTFLGFVHVPFTVDYQTADGSAQAGSDYTATSGSLTFNGRIGSTRTISVPISNDGIPENAEDFIIEFTGANASYATINFSDTGTGTINSQILANDPLTLFQEFDGYFDYSTTGGTLRTGANGSSPCSITTSSSNSLVSPIPLTATIERAYLYWAHSENTRDDTVTFEGQSVSANFLYQTSLGSRNFYGYVSDVTSIVQSIPNPSTNTFDFSGLTIDNTGSYCSTSTVLGGWTLIVFYEDLSLPAVNINLYQGFDGLSNEGTSFTLDSFFAISGSGAKATFLSWEGDPDLDGSSGGSTNPEALSVTSQGGTTYTLSGDGGQPGNNAYNSSIYDNTVGPVYNNTTSYGVDLDTYDISSYISPGDSQVTANVDVGQDFVISTAVVLKVPSNLISGTVFEDHNYPGGPGRDLVASGGAGVSGAVVELFDNSGNFVERTSTNINGDYSFGGMADGSYSVKVVNYTVRSNRTGGLNCSECIPVQTFRIYGSAGSLTSVTDEVGGTDPSAIQDAALGILSGAQSVSSVSVAGNGVVGVDFGFNFNTIVNTNESGQGSLEQFIVNANNLDETGLDIESNSLFDPAAGEDVSIFMIPSSADPLGRTADTNFNGSYFDIAISDSFTMSALSSDNLHIDGRTQTAYSGNTNAGTTGAGGTAVGVSATPLPDFDLPEIQLHRDIGDVMVNTGSDNLIRGLSLYANDNAAILVNGGDLSVSGNLLGVDGSGSNAGDIDSSVEVTAGNVTIDGNYISTLTNQGIWIRDTSGAYIANNQIDGNGTANCGSNILIEDGSDIEITRNLIINAEAVGIEAAGVPGFMEITENTIVGSGQDTGCFSGEGGVGIRIGGSNTLISQNIIYQNGNAGIAVVDNSGTGNTISQNAIYANGTTAQALGIDLDSSGGYGDGVTINDLGDADGGPNGSNNFTMISAAYLSGTELVIKGWSGAGDTIEFFFSDINEGTASVGDNQLGKTFDYGEGQTYIATVTEGSGADLDAGSSPYTDADGNTDTTNRFEFRVALPPGTQVGDWLTATATRAGSTSEFGPMTEIRVRTVITNRRITYRVNN